jgi:hypothetical protein
MFQIISEVITVAARASSPRDAEPLREAPRPRRFSLIWRRLG